MRQIGTLSDLREAQTFQDFLLTRGVKAKIEAEASDWAVWVFDEDDVPTAKDELTAFRANPADARYKESSREAEKIRDAAIQRAKEAQKNVVDVRRRWQGPGTSRFPVTYALIAISVAVAFGTQLAQEGPMVQQLSFSSYTIEGNYIRWQGLQDPKNDIRRGEIWRLFSPMFLHFSFFHILFNMLWLRDLGTAIEFRRGSTRFVIIVLVIAAISNLAQYLYKAPNFGGMSGVVFGLFGYVWLKGRYDPASGFFMPPINIWLMLGWLAFCTTGYAGPIANMAHGAGLATGAVIAYAPIAWRDLTRGS